MKKLLCLLLASALMLLSCTIAFAASAVIDDALLFSDDDLVMLDEQINRMQDDYGMNFAIITVDEPSREDVEPFAMECYDMYIGDDRVTGGVMLFINMGTRDVHIRAYNSAMDIFPVSDLDDMRDEITPSLSSESYFEAAAIFLALMDNIIYYYEPDNSVTPVEEDINSEPAEKSTATVWHYVTYAAIALFAALITCALVSRRYKTTKKQQTAQYLNRSSINYSLSSDTFVGTHTSVVKINTSSGSGGSSGGSSSGSHGSSGKF